MRFLMMVKAGADYEAGAPPSPELMAAIGRLTEEATRAGTMISSEGLLPTAAGARVRVGRGKLTVTDGPFTEAKEVVGGYAILRAPSRKEAIELAKALMKAHADVLGPSYEGEVEIRQLFEAADFAGGRK
jgi:hypothetical protein